MKLHKIETYAPVRNGRDEDLPVRVQKYLWDAMPYAWLVVAMALWLVSLPFIDPSRMNDIGLLAVLPATFYIALGLLTFSFTLLAAFRPERTRALLLHLATLLAMFHATPTIVYGTLRYSWAWKHVGMVDYIQRHAGVNPNIVFNAAYHNWPGFSH